MRRTEKEKEIRTIITTAAAYKSIVTPAAKGMK